ncbi:hypothetical protein [Hydrogenimonas sp.]
MKKGFDKLVTLSIAGAALAAVVSALPSQHATQTAALHCIHHDAENGGSWEYLKDWFDGYNLHPYAKVGVEISDSGRVTYRRDRATGMVLFRDIGPREYAEAGCPAPM